MKKILTYEQQQMKLITETLEEYFGCEIPNPVNYPESYLHYLTMYTDRKNGNG